MKVKIGLDLELRETNLDMDINKRGFIIENCPKSSECPQNRIIIDIVSGSLSMDHPIISSGRPNHIKDQLFIPKRKTEININNFRYNSSDVDSVAESNITQSVIGAQNIQLDSSRQLMPKSQFAKPKKKRKQKISKT